VGDKLSSALYFTGNILGSHRFFGVVPAFLLRSRWSLVEASSMLTQLLPLALVVGVENLSAITSHLAKKRSK
jgi:hypothetical protein